jgi:hypothetical protein
MVDVDGRTLVLPINTSTTLGSAVASYTTPASAAAAGYPHWVQPSKNTALYSEIFDYEATLPATKITVDKTFTILDGVVSTWTNIYTRATTTDAWTTVVTSGVEAYAQNFRYVRTDLNFVASGGDDLATVTDFVVRLDSKLKNDAGNSTVDVPASGAEVVFNVDFVDVESITITPAAGGSARTAIYDFTDVPNPSSFTAYLFNENGVYVSGAFSWNARGY